LLVLIVLVAVPHVHLPSVRVALGSIEAFAMSRFEKGMTSSDLTNCPLRGHLGGAGIADKVSRCDALDSRAGVCTLASHLTEFSNKLRTLARLGTSALSITDIIFIAHKVPPSY
jgi:hypothetical protein